MSKKEKTSTKEIYDSFRKIGMKPEEIIAACLIMIEHDINRIAEKLAGSDE